MKYSICIINGFILIFLIRVIPTKAQIVPDESLPKNSSVRQKNSVFEIDGGTRKGQNLFHSFNKFSIPKNSKAHFKNAATVDFIFSRVTGSSVSNIDGIIRANSAADLFFINPNGIVFGPNAALQLGGSFIASTATSMVFKDGTQFSTVLHQTDPVLTISTPVGMRFGRTVGNIINRSQAPLIFNEQPILDQQGIPVPGGLQVLPKNTLALIGGNISFDNGRLTAPSGRVELGSVSSLNQVDLDLNISGWDIRYGRVGSFKNITFANVSFVNANDIGQNPGAIEIISKDVDLFDRSGLFTSNFGSSRGGFITINTEKLKVRNGSTIISTANNEGNAGGVNIIASESINLSGTSSIARSRISSDTLSSGNAGDVEISTETLIITGGAQITANTFSTGQGGRIRINTAKLIKLTGTGKTNEDQFSSSILTRSSSLGNAGDIKVSTEELLVDNGATISVSSTDLGKTGNLKIMASSVRLNNQGKLQAESTQGKGGNITLELGNFLFMLGNSEISAKAGSTEKPGDGGNITVFADNVVAAPNTNSDIFANSFGGKGGAINITARHSLFGFQESNDPNFRDNITNDITAQSSVNPKLNGQVSINTGEIDPSENLSDQPEVIKPSQEIAQGCRPGQALGGSTFTHVGRGGLPPSPHETQTPATVWQDLRAHNLQTPSLAANNPATSLTPTSPPSIVEAKSWTKDAQGRIYLTANNPKPAHSPQATAVTC